MSTTGNNTLDRIQKEIKESLQREDELRNKYEKLNNNNEDNVVIVTTQNEEKSSGTTPLNGTNSNSTQKLNGWRRFTPNNSTTRGVMQKFLKLRGRITQPAIQTTNPTNNNTWVYDDVFQPAKVTVEKGKPVRNGFVPAEEKMRRELEEFQKREDELRTERRKSQPNLMAALDLEEESNYEHKNENGFLKPAKSLANIYSSTTSETDEDEFRDNNHSSAPCSLKPARSLAVLCAVSDEELEMPGTYSLIMQFEKMKSQQVRS